MAYSRATRRAARPAAGRGLNAIAAPAAAATRPIPSLDAALPAPPLWLIKACIVVAVLLLALTAALTWSEATGLIEGFRQTAPGRVIGLVTLSTLAINLAVLAWRIVLVARYRPTVACSDTELPTCSVIVPAYNEGSCVLDTLRSIAASDYPESRMQIIAVDDGSRDDTWQWIVRAVEEMPDRILAVRMPANGGKRKALYEGIRRSDGEVIVTIDSDSLIEPQTLRRMVSPFVRDGRIGGVAGNVRVLNRGEGLISRMLDVSFAYSFDFIRASQSAVDTVMCTPGALSAYRRSVVVRVIGEWLDQRFMGRPAMIGEDRAMTNLILREGYHVTYQSDAVVFTKVPTRYKGLCKMFLRWARSNIRETIAMSRFAFGRFRSTPATGARINLVLSWIALTAGQAMKVAALGSLVWLGATFGLRMLLGAVATALIPAAFYAIRHRSSDALWAILYGAFWLAGLSWIGVYALCTLHKNGWLTRELTAARRRPAPAVAAALADARPA